MDSPNLPNGFNHAGFDGPGAIGKPTSLYNHLRKADDLGLNTLLSQARNDRAGNLSEYGIAESTTSRWEDWGRSTRAVDNLGFPDIKYGNGNGPISAPLFPTTSASPHLSLQGLNIGTGPGVSSADAATQALGHLSSLQSLIAPMASAAEEVAKLKNEVEKWKNDWHKLGEEKRGMERAVNEYKAEMEKDKQNVSAKQAGPSFSVVLIDGDGLIFQDAHLQAGYKGGLGAARKLLSSLSPMLHHASISPTSQSFGSDVTIKSSELASDREVGTAIINVFLNKAGLGQTLINAKIVTEKLYNSFFEGLNSAHELISVIDVGPGKEAADAKIREHLKLYARNAQCEMIVLGASHDNGYANILSSLQTENRLSKLLLLKGYADLAGQLRQYSSRVVTIPDLFRTTKVPLSFSSIAATPATPAAKKQTITKTKPKQAASHRDDDTSSEGTGQGSIEVLEWKEVIKKPQSSKKEGPSPMPATTKSGKKKSKKSQSHSVRLLDPRPCHTYYLSDRGCRTGEECDYSHDYNLNDAEIEDLRRLAKEMVCPYIRNNKCHFAEEDCVYGHYCPRGDSCKFGDSCRFSFLPNGHGEDD